MVLFWYKHKTNDIEQYNCISQTNGRTSATVHTMVTITEAIHEDASETYAINIFEPFDRTMQSACKGAPKAVKPTTGLWPATHPPLPEFTAVITATKATQLTFLQTAAVKLVKENSEPLSSDIYLEINLSTVIMYT